MRLPIFAIPAHYFGAAMNDSDFLVVFTLDDQRYALALSATDRVVRMVAVTPLPNAPDIVLGVVNFQGRVIPVINVRRRFGVPEKQIDPGDQLIIAHTARRSVALVADAVLDVIMDTAQSRIAAEHILPRLEYVAGVIKLADGLILIHDLEKFLSLEEEDALDRVLETA